MMNGDFAKNYLNYPMEIIWFGKAFFILETKGADNRDLRIALDPFDRGSGVCSLTKNPPEMVLLSSRTLNDKEWKGSSFVIKAPGEYEKRGIFIYAIRGFTKSEKDEKKEPVVIYKILAEGLKICYLGFFGQKEISSEQLEAIGEVDILMVPIAPEETLNPKQAAKIVTQIEPRIVVPMFYKTKDQTGKSEDLEKFLKEMGAEDIAPQPYLKIKKNLLPKEETRVVVLKPKQ